MTTCLHCGSRCRRSSGREVYLHRPDLWEKPIYVCDPCGARVGCHPGTERPLCQAVNAETRKARMRVHALIDPFWKDRAPRTVKRRTVYRFMQERFGMTEAECHVGCFDAEACDRVIEGMASVTRFEMHKWSSANPDRKKGAA